MAKLYFRYGVTGSAKTMNLLAVYESYRRLGKSVFAIKPSIDTRSGVQFIASRSGLKIKADLVVNDLFDLIAAQEKISKVDCLLVDEAQFFPKEIIEFLHYNIATKANVPVICYGLRTDYLNKTFAGSLRLLELADSIEEIKTVCADCNKKAIFSGRIDQAGSLITQGNVIQIGGSELYKPLCKSCYWNEYFKTNNTPTTKKSESDRSI